MADFSWFFVISGFFHAYGCIWNPRNIGQHWRGWAGMSNPPEWYDISIFGAFFAYYLLFFVILRVFHAFGCSWRLQGNKGAQVEMPALKNGMLLRFFSHFSLIFRYFSLFYAFFTRLDAPGGSRGTREHRWECPALKNGMLLRFFNHFSLIFRHFSRF